MQKLNIQIIERKLIRSDGKPSVLMKVFPNLFTEVALYKLKQKL